MKLMISILATFAVCSSFAADECTIEMRNARFTLYLNGVDTGIWSTVIHTVSQERHKLIEGNACVMPANLPVCKILPNGNGTFRILQGDQDTGWQYNTAQIATRSRLDYLMYNACR